MDILTKRPEGMDFKEYKALLKIQDKVIRRYLKGKFVWLSKLEPTPTVLKYLYESNLMNSMGRLLHKGETFRGKVKDLK